MKAQKLIKFTAMCPSYHYYYTRLTASFLKAEITYDNVAKHFAVGNVEAAVSIALQFDVLHRVIATVSATVTVRQKWPKNFDERLHCREAPTPSHKLPFLLERSGLPTNRRCLGPTHVSPHPKQHLDQVSSFSTARVCVQQTNTETDTQTTLVTIRDVTVS